MATVGVAVLLLLVTLGVTGTLSTSLCPQHCQSCAHQLPVECTDDREYVPKPDCPTCCVVCAQKLEEQCDDQEKPCANDLFCSSGKCQELPAALKASDPPIELLEYAAINSSAVRFLVRLPQYTVWPTSYAQVTSSRTSVGPWVPVPGATNVTTQIRELELTASGLEGSIHILRIEHGEYHSRAVRIHLPAPEATTTAFPVSADSETCEHFGRQFAIDEGYLSSDCMQRCECVSAGNFTCSSISNDAAAACRAAARKRGISGAETLEVLDSNEDTVSLKWRGPVGMILQARELGAIGPWKRTERLTPDGTKEPSNVTFGDLQPFTTYEFRAVLPGSDDGRSARLEDTPLAAVATTRPHPGQDAGVCVVLGRKIASGEEIPTPNGACTESKCLCIPGQPPSCKQRCVIPFFRRGAFSDDAQCEEKPSPDDPCCVVVRCSDSVQDATEEHGQSDPCEQCAVNAECHKSMIASIADEALCMCKDGFEGDPYNKKIGCKALDASASAKIADRMDRCVFKNRTYMPGENFTEGCEHKCTCTSEAEIICEPRCPDVPESPVSGCKIITDPKDECCRVVVCEDMDKSKPATPLSADKDDMMCHYKNGTFQRGLKFDDGCDKRCTCTDNGVVSCVPRCPQIQSVNASDDKCVTMRDPHDHCCMLVLCDVTLADQDLSKTNVANIETSSENDNTTQKDDEVTMVPPTKRISLQLVETVNSTAARLEAKLPGDAKWPANTPSVAVFMRSVSGHWKKVPSMIAAPGSDGKLKLTVDGLESGTTHLRVEHNDMRSEELEVELPAAAAGSTCEYKGQTYKRDDEFHDGCDMYCACTKTGVQCATIECPTDFGLDVLDPHCLDWEAEPGFVATPPRCCPDMRCRNNGSCHYQGHRFDNFAEIPTKISGCEQQCYCDFGNVSCNPTCPPVPAIPPSSLHCSPSEARLAHLPGEDCCKYWLCPTLTSIPSSPAGNASSSLNVTHGEKPDVEVTSSVSPTFDNMTTHDVTIVPHITNATHGEKPDAEVTTSVSPTLDNMTPHDVTLVPHVTNVTHSEKSDAAVTTSVTPIMDLTTPHNVTLVPFIDDDVKQPLTDLTTIINETTTISNTMNETNTKQIIDNVTETIQTRVNSKEKNETKEEFHGPFVINPNMEHKNESHDFTWPFMINPQYKKPGEFLGPFVPIVEEKPLEHHPSPQHQGVPNESKDAVFSPTPVPSFSPDDVKLTQHLGNMNATVSPVFIPTPVPPSDQPPQSEGDHIRPHQPGLVNDTQEVIPHFIPEPLPPPSKPTQKFPGPFVLQRPDDEHHQPPFPISGRPQQQAPPGPFLFHGEPIPGPDSINDEGPQIIGQTPDGHIIIAQNPRNPNIRVPPRGHQEFNTYHEGQPPFIQERPNNEGRRPPPGLSPIAAQIEQHLQRQQNNRYHHPEEEVYHVRPHQGRPPTDAEVYHLPPEGEHFVLQDGSIVRIAPPSTNSRPHFTDDRQRPPQHIFHPPERQLIPKRPQLPPHLADLTPEQVLAYVRPPGNVTSGVPHDVDSSHTSLEHTASRPPQGFPSRPPGMNPPFPPHQGNEIVLQTPHPTGPRSVRLMFTVPSIFVGLHGHVEVRYTDNMRNKDPSTWKEASGDANEIIESPQLMHEVSGLKPATSYQVQVVVRLRDLHNVVTSPVVEFTTPSDSAAPSATTLPPIIPIDAGLSVSGANSTWISLSWRKFSEYELQFIDGVQIRYKERDGKVYAATPLLHRLVDSYTLEDLRPGTEYEVAIFFIPFPGQNTELQAERSVQATTAPLQADPYGFDLALTVGQVKGNSVELTWSGVPYPEDKYVNIYRAIYQSDLEVGKQELSSTFKLAKRDAPPRTIVMDLKPLTRYRIWLEAYLTNGKIKKSDVRTFTTKPGSLLSAGASEQLSGKEERSDYYGALVAVAIVAALAVVGLVILLMILVRRQSAASAAITTPRPAKAESAAYDNPTYKTCDDPTPAATNGSSKHHNNSPTTHEEP